jgi:hypothetical protein
MEPVFSMVVGHVDDREDGGQVEQPDPPAGQLVVQFFDAVNGS